jgi:glycosyltransferase involved in cell wall biosynthesis
MSAAPQLPRLDKAVSVTVVIACHNGGPFIREAIKSCLAQSTPPAEIVVIDDASTDNSAQVLDEFARAGAIRLQRNSVCMGKALSINRVFSEITTKYIAILDADDIAAPNRIEKQVAFMEGNSRLGCSSSFVRYINAAGKRLANGVLDLLTEEDLKRYLAGGDPFGLFCPSVMLRTEVVKDPRLQFRERFWPADDIDLWNRIAEAGWLVLAQPEFLTFYRVHSNSAVTSGARRTRKQFEWVRASLRARRQGKPEPTLEEFNAYLASLPWHEKFNRWRKTEAKAACRAAGFAYAERRIFRTIGWLLKGFCLQPRYVYQRLTHQLTEP